MRTKYREKRLLYYSVVNQSSTEEQSFVTPHALTTYRPAGAPAIKTDVMCAWRRPRPCPPPLHPRTWKWKANLRALQPGATLSAHSGIETTNSSFPAS